VGPTKLVASEVTSAEADTLDLRAGKEGLVNMSVILSVPAVRDAPLTYTTNADAEIDMRRGQSTRGEQTQASATAIGSP
jgi:hypothetical protein